MSLVLNVVGEQSQTRKKVLLDKLKLALFFSSVCHLYAVAWKIRSHEQKRKMMSNKWDTLKKSLGSCLHDTNPDFTENLHLGRSAFVKIHMYVWTRPVVVY